MNLEKIKIWSVTDGSQGMISQTMGLSKQISSNIKEIKTDLIFPWNKLQPGLLPTYKWIFKNNRPPSEESSRQELIKMLIDMAIKNPKVYNMPDDIKIINQVDYFKNLSNEDISQKYDEIILFQTLLIFGRYGAKDYVNLLIELIEENKPSLMALNAAERYRNSFLAPSSG